MSNSRSHLCPRQCNGDGDLFYTFWQATKTKIKLQDSLKIVLEKFVDQFIPRDSRHKFCSQIATSAVEGWNSYLHRRLPKAMYLIEAKKAFQECLVKAFRNTFQKAFFLNWQGIAQYLSETVN